MQSHLDLSELEFKVNRLNDELTEALDNAAEPLAIEQLIEQQQIALDEFENEKSKSIKEKFHASTSFIQSKLYQLGVQAVHSQSVEPLEKFTDEEILEIKRRYNQIPAPLKALIDAALDDDRIQCDYVKNPVFIRGEGHLYDLSSIQLMLKGKTEANFPNNPEAKFSMADVIPCNTLIRAMKILLNILKGHNPLASAVEKNTFASVISDRRRISPEVIKMIESYYASPSLEENHRALFDVICRDRLTKMIMDDPVYLPDGYTYDRSTAMFLLESAYPSDRALCPFNDEITFTKDDMTESYTVMRVLDQLKANIEASQKQAPPQIESAILLPTFK